MSALDLLAGLLDAGTFQSWDTSLAGPPAADAVYGAHLARARAATGIDESVVTGEGLLRGHRVAAAASEFGFLGGSIGVAAGERLTAAVERATRERLPLVVLPASGGTRMQEGTLAFLQMIKITAATPIDPPRKPNSDAATATRWPPSSPSPVTTDSSMPVAARALARWAPYAASAVSGPARLVSQDWNVPASSSPARRSRAFIQRQGDPPGVHR